MHSLSGNSGGARLCALGLLGWVSEYVPPHTDLKGRCSKGSVLGWWVSQQSDTQNPHKNAGCVNVSFLLHTEEMETSRYLGSLTRQSDPNDSRSQ